MGKKRWRAPCLPKGEFEASVRGFEHRKINSSLPQYGNTETITAIDSCTKPIVLLSENIFFEIKEHTTGLEADILLN